MTSISWVMSSNIHHLAEARSPKENSEFTFPETAQFKLEKSYHFKPGDVSLRSLTLGEVLDESTEHHGNKKVFISAFQKISKTFSEFRKEADKFASGLLSFGLEKGDRIGIFSPNCYEWLLTQFAAAKAGLILVTINPVSTAKELEFCLKEVDCKALVMWDVLKDQDFYQTLSKIVPNLAKSDPNKLISERLPSLKTVIMISKHKKKGVINFHDAQTSGNKESDKKLSAIKKSLQFDDPLCIMFTSGTTGEPKAVLLSHHNVVNNAMLMSRRVHCGSMKEISCCFYPLFRPYGYVLSVVQVTSQLTCVLPSPEFDAVDTLKSIEKYKCTTLHGAPLMYENIMQSQKTLKSNIGSLQQATFLEAGVTETIVKEMKNVLNIHHFHNLYGSTELSPTLINGLHDSFSFQDVVSGFMETLEYLEVKLIDSKGLVVPIHTRGELCLRGHHIFMGYWNDKKSEVFDKERWYHTGDCGIMDERGWIKIVGRRNDIIIRGGEDIYPLEVENFLNTHPAVLEVHICGVPDKILGEEACAWISLKKGMALKEDEVKSFCKGNISPFKIPRYVVFVEDFPKTQTGETKKYQMTKDSIKNLDL